MGREDNMWVNCSHNQNKNFRFLTSSEITTGAPISEVMALIGRVYSVPGICAAISQTSIKIAPPMITAGNKIRSEEHTSELQSRENIVCRLPLEKKKARRAP